MSVPNPTGIEAVSRALLDLLADGLGAITVDEDAVNVELVSPSRPEMTDIHLAVYLYRIARNGGVSNRERHVDADGTVREPPLALDLHYLLTAPPAREGEGPPETTDTYEQHRILGRAIQVLHDNPLLKGLQSDEDPRVTMNAESMNEVLDVWSTFQETPYRPSVSYLVSPVLIESTRTESVPPVAEWHVPTYTRSRPPEAPEPPGDENGEAPP